MGRCRCVGWDGSHDPSAKPNECRLLDLSNMSRVGLASPKSVRVRGGGSWEGCGVTRTAVPASNSSDDSKKHSSRDDGNRTRAAAVGPVGTDCCLDHSAIVACGCRRVDLEPTPRRRAGRTKGSGSMAPRVHPSSTSGAKGAYCRTCTNQLRLRYIKSNAPDLEMCSEHALSFLDDEFHWKFCSNDGALRHTSARREREL